MDGDFNDEHAGKGGSYVVGEDGKRVLQERTETNPDRTTPAKTANQERTAPAKPATKPKPTVIKGDSNA